MELQKYIDSLTKETRIDSELGMERTRGYNEALLDVKQYLSQSKQDTCKIDSHIPTWDGYNCECGYFRVKPFGDFLTGLEKGIKDKARQDLIKILDFVERWNKQDKENRVADSARRLEEWVKSDKSIHSLPLSSESNEPK